jgi:hypothetical protein
MRQDNKGNFRPLHLPVSPRNMLVFFLLNDGYENRFMRSLAYLLQYDLKEIETLQAVPDRPPVRLQDRPTDFHGEFEEEHQPQVPKKKKKIHS